MPPKGAGTPTQDELMAISAWLQPKMKRSRGRLLVLGATEDGVAARTVGEVDDGGGTERRRRIRGRFGNVFAFKLELVAGAHGISIGRPVGSVAVWMFIATSTLVVSTIDAW